MHPSSALRVFHVLHCACVLLACLSLAKINPFTPVCAMTLMDFTVLLQKILPINGEPLGDERVKEYSSLIVSQGMQTEFREAGSMQ